MLQGSPSLLHSDIYSFRVYFPMLCYFHCHMQNLRKKNILTNKLNVFFGRYVFSLNTVNVRKIQFTFKTKQHYEIQNIKYNT